MIIANQLRGSNRAEYLLYMWQVEDILRLYDCSPERIANEYLTRFQLDSSTAAEMRQWYAELCEMMRSEQKTQGGHLQICENVIIGLADLNDQLLASSRYPYYKQMYYRVLPYVVELRARTEVQPSVPEGGGQPESSSVVEIRQLFSLLYGVMLLRLQQKPISPDTSRAVADVTALLGQLSDYWKAERAGELPLD